MMTTVRLRFVLAWLVTTALLLAGCGSDGGGAPVETGRRLELVGASSLVLDAFAEQVIEVRYLEADGTRISDAIVDFAIEGNPEGGNLSAGAARTDDAGLARVALRAGEPAMFRVTVVAPLADPLTITVEVRQMRHADLEYTVSYPGNRRLAFVEAALFSNVSCSQLASGSVPQPRDVQGIRLDRREVFTGVEIGVPVAVYALGITSSDTVAAEGCSNARVDADGEQITITMVDTGANGGLFETEEIYDVSGSSIMLDITEALFGLAGDPAGWLVDFIADSGLAPGFIETALDFGPTRALIISLIDDFVRDTLPFNYDDSIRDAHDDFVAALSEMTFIGELEWEEDGVETFDEFGQPKERMEHPGFHRIKAAIMPLDTDRTLEYTLNAETELLIGLDEERIDLPEHELDIPLGWLIEQLLDNQLLPRLPGSPADMGEFVDYMFDCRELGADFGLDATADEELTVQICEFGAQLLGDTLDRWFQDLTRSGEFFMSGEANIFDRDRDYLMDRIEDGTADGRWESQAETLEFPGTWSGERIGDIGVADHPVLRAIRNMLR